MTTPDFEPRLQLLRREAFDRDVVGHVASALKSDEPLVLIMIDLDKFKSVNDQHGHPVGDEVLQEVAGSIRRVVGSKGKSYRYGGEELCVLLVNYTADEGAALAERIRAQIEQVPVSSKQLKITASIGVAELPVHAQTAAELLQKADAAMYQAKDLGRNLVRISGEPRPTALGPRPAARRQPIPDGLSDQQAETIRQDYFKRAYAKCPHDGAQLTVERLEPPYNRNTPNLLVSCPLCGLDAELEGPS